ncbi:PREDICTED: toll-like receptor 6 [Nicrophorus vespilloides]|uniref:Toll-like receptor 6 n=1 Tax=Nicrophorus vespilloides TaxID=110193 RepID=A0ABM1MHA4_NICVS|nr:PREDICTED: toll-like receptor 6 [Nicrophorus vespilloides]
MNYFVILILWLAASGGEAQISCSDECVCYLDTKGRNVVDCKEGGMVGPLVLANVSTKIEVLKITAPEDNMNELTMNPVIGNFKNLEEIHIIRSNIPNLGMHFFYELHKLEVLDLSQNNITQLLPPNFLGLNKLHELNLDDNRISSLPSETFRYLKELKVLSLQKNRIEVLSQGVFRLVVKLRVLKLNGNYIRDFHPDVFKYVKDLRVLECRGCMLTVLNPLVHELLPHLTHLDIGENQVTWMDATSFRDLRKLKVLKLDSNQLSVIPTGVLSNHTDLKRLHLGRNSISNVEEGAFRNLVNVSELDLGYNKLERLEGDALRDTRKSLERLVLSGNKLRADDIKELLAEMSVLKDLQMAEMALGALDEGVIPETVAVLNLGGNQLPYLAAYVLPRDLKDLDLSRNVFRGLQDDVVKKVENVRCKLDNNPWSCDLCHITHMLASVNRSRDFYSVRCSLPYHHRNKILGTLDRDELSWCNAQSYSSEGANLYLSRDDGRLGIIAAAASLLLLLLTALAVLAAVFYTRRHAARYYTHEERRLDEKEAIFENQSPLFGEELSFKFPLDPIDRKISIATIDEIKKEQRAVSNGT